MKGRGLGSGIIGGKGLLMQRIWPISLYHFRGVEEPPADILGLITLYFPEIIHYIAIL